MIKKLVLLSGCMLMAAVFYQGEAGVKKGKVIRYGADSVTTDSVKKDSEGGKNTALADTSMKAKAKKDSVKKEKPYEQLLKRPQKAVKGLMNLYYVKEKLYLEVPLKLMGKDMLLASTISETSDNGDGVVGSKPTSPLLVKFSKIDSSLVLTKTERNMFAPESDGNLIRALDKNNIGAIMKIFEIKAYNPDTTAAVIDVTDYFVGDIKELSPFGSFSIYKSMGFKSSESFKKDRSFITDIKAFKDNISIKSNLSYENTLSNSRRTLIKDKPFSVVLTRTLLLLPPLAVRPRIADPRIGVFSSKRYRLSNTVNKTEDVYFAYRWNLVPKDKAAYKSGKLVAPVKPVTFYIDRDFPEGWKKSIKAAINDWNKPFEKIGFKNAVVALDYPVNDPEFDPDNLKYNCVRYSPVPIANVVGPAWVDPRTGEIISASVYVFHDIVKLLNNQMFIQTSPANKEVRTARLPEAYKQEGIRSYVRHEVGHCLGFNHNYAASAGVPVESLRSPSFTNKYGTTYSIMDNAHFNYVAQPEDAKKGLRLTEPMFGPYDYLLVQWSYTFFDKPASERAELDKMISSKAGDVRYRYAKAQGIDPGVLSDDLGDDAVKASAYGIANLKYIMENLNTWVAKEDKDYSFRREIWEGILAQYVKYVNFILPNIGGIYVNEKYEGDPQPSYQSVPRKKQEEALRFLLAQISDVDWIENREVLQNMTLTGTPSNLLRIQIMEALLQTPLAVNLSASKSKEPNPFTSEEVMKDIYEAVWKSTEKGSIPGKGEKEMQKAFINSIIKNAKLITPIRGGQAGQSADGFRGVRLTDIMEEARMGRRNAGGLTEVDFSYPFADNASGSETEGFGGSLVNFNLQPSLESMYFVQLTNCKELLSRRVADAGDKETEMHYRLLLNKIDKALNL